jgi:hypothetical protein
LAAQTKFLLASMAATAAKTMFPPASMAAALAMGMVTRHHCHKCLPIGLLHHQPLSLSSLEMNFPCLC